MSGKGTVEDGTRCKADKNTYDVCIQGKCRVSDLRLPVSISSSLKRSVHKFISAIYG